MATLTSSVIPELIETHHERLLSRWLTLQEQSRPGGDVRISGAQLTDQSRQFLEELRKGVTSGGLRGIHGGEWVGMHRLLEEVSRTRTAQGFTPSETATFVFSIKEPLFELIQQEAGKDAAVLGREVIGASVLLDRLGLFTTELAQKSRDAVIVRQQQELLELSTPVVELWEGILALPLIGTLDSERTQVVMESLLQQIVTSSAEIAIIDITGVPTVDTLVAQHLIKTVSAARLMGADCIISGIRPQIAQTIVHLGLDLSVVSKATMADAFALALRRTGRRVETRAALAPVIN